MIKDDDSQSRSEITRERMIQAGLELFGLRGFYGTTTRMLAKKAGANISAIPYHFGGKEGLYRAVAERIGQMIFKNFEECVVLAEELLDSGRIDRQEAFTILLTFLSRFANMAVGSDTGSVFGPIITREQMHPTPAFDEVFDKYFGRLHKVFTGVLSVLTGTDARDPETIIQAQTLFGQLLAFRAGREIALRRLEWNTIGPKELALLKRTVFRIVQKQLGADDLTIMEEVYE